VGPKEAVCTWAGVMGSRHMTITRSTRRIVRQGLKHWRHGLGVWVCLRHRLLRLRMGAHQYDRNTHTGDCLSMALLSLLNQVSITQMVFLYHYPHDFDLTAAFYRLAISLLMVPRTTSQCCRPFSQHWNHVVLSSV